MLSNCATPFDTTPSSTTTPEGWRVVAEAPDYEVSSEGRLRRASTGKNTPAGTILSPGLNPNGYRQARLWVPSEKRRIHRYMHRLVAIAFLGEPVPPRIEVNHRNGTKDDNRVANLEWVAGEENVQHAQETGLARGCPPEKVVRGMEHPAAKLTDEKVIAMRAARDAGATYGVIARDVGCSRATARDVVTSRYWRHLPPCKSVAVHRRQLRTA